MASKNYYEEFSRDAVELYRSGMRAAITRGMRERSIAGLRLHRKIRTTILLRSIMLCAGFQRPTPGRR